MQDIPQHLKDKFTYMADMQGLSTPFSEIVICLMFAAYQLADEERWVHICEYPKDNPIVQRWHKIYKCVVSVYLKPGISTVKGCDWVTGTLDHTWPEAAFEPVFKLLPTPPLK